MDAIAVQDSRNYSLVVLYDMHTDFFEKALDGISDEDAHRRLETDANHIAWLAGSLVQQRFDIAGLLGHQQRPTADTLFKNFQGIKSGVTYPPLTDFLVDWHSITPLLRQQLCELSVEQNNFILDFGEMKMSRFDFISFSIYREANCIGQIALWRRLLDYPALKYD